MYGSVVYILIVSSTVEICFEMPTSELFQGMLGRFEGSVVYIIVVSSTVEICFEMPTWAVLRVQLFTY